MKHLIKRISVLNSEAIGYSSIGGKTFNLIRKGNSIKGFLDGYEVYSISEKDPRFKEAGIVIASVLDYMFKSSEDKKIRLYKSEWKNIKESSVNLLEEIIPNLNDSVGNPVVIIRNKPKEERDIRLRAASGFSAEGCIPTEILMNNLEVLKKKISALSSDLEESLDVASTFTRRKLKDSMWGAKPMQQILDSLRSEFLNKCWNQAYVSLELIEKSIDRLVYKFKSIFDEECFEEKKMVVGVLIPDIIESYAKIKDVVIRLVTLLAPLILMDKTFTEKTSYPAKFFISDEIIEQTQNRFNVLIKFLCLSPTIESKVLDPLDFVRLQMLNEIKGS